MGKLSMALVLLLSTLFFHGNGGSITQLNSIDDDSDLEQVVETWYDQLSHLRLVTTKLQIFFHGINKVNEVQVAKSLIPGTDLPPLFGMVAAFDYNVTATQDINSELLGYGQGFFVESSKEEFSAWLGYNLVLTKYSNSTITLLGQDKLYDKYRELTIVGGTGHFRLATGSATLFDTYNVMDVVTVRLTMFVRHYSFDKASATA